MKVKAIVAVAVAIAGLGAAIESSTSTPAQTTQCVASAYAGGTSDAITIPALPCALTTNLLILTPVATNTTTTPTLQPLGLAAQPIVRANGVAVLPGDLVANGRALLSPTGSSWILLNPATGGLAVTDFGADPAGVADSTTAIQAAVTAAGTTGCVYVPPGTYKVTNAITFPASNGCMRGAGRMLSTIMSYSTSFNLAALGVFVLPNTGGGTGAQLSDLGFDFNQPQTNVRANIVAFPPAIYAQGNGRMLLQNIRVSDAKTCLDARGNTGGSFIDTFECGAMTEGMLWDGAQDSVRISNFHFWPFGIQFVGGSLLYQVYNDLTNECFNIGRIDDLKAVNWACESARGTFTANANLGGLSQSFTNLSMDAPGAGLFINGGYIDFDGGYSTAGSVTGGAALVVAGSANYVQFNNFRFSSAAQVATIQHSSGWLNFTNSIINCTFPTVSCMTVSNGVLGINGGTILSPYTVAQTWTQPYVAQSGTGSLAVTSALFTTSGAGQGPGIAWATDAALNTAGLNSMNGWSYSFPAAMTLGSYTGQTVTGLNVTHPTGAANLNLNGATAGQGEAIYFYDAGANKWIIANNGSNQLVIADQGSAFFLATHNGTLSFGSGSMTVTVASRLILNAGLAVHQRTVAQLNSIGCTGANKGDVYTVTDLNVAPTYNAIMGVAGSTFMTLVQCDGTNWRTH